VNCIAPTHMHLSIARAALIPVGFAAALLAVLALPQIGRDPNLVRSFVGAAGVLVVWAAVLFVTASRAGRVLSIRSAVRKPHYIQMFAQGTVLVYWGWHVRMVQEWAPLILAQILFAFGVDALLQWSRRDTYGMGLGPVPVMFSMNLFLWFKPEWFHFQFAMVAVGFLAKELIRWQKDGKSAHIFNPSSFPLAIASLLLIATGTTDITWGVAIAQTQYNPPYIFAVIFLASLPGQLLFGVATMTWSAVVSAYVFGLLYFQITGVYYFYDSFIPIAVFLGMHLLFTDPSTSPKSESGRVIFGVLYGMSCIGLVVVLGALGAPEFYDKLLPVPILNLSVRWIDRVAQAPILRRLEPGRLLAIAPLRETRLRTAGLWIVTFLAVRALGGVGDHHPGQYLPFWDQACEAGKGRACEHLADMQQVYCARESGWACNERGIVLQTEFGMTQQARLEFQRACALGFQPGCDNVLFLISGTDAFATALPPDKDLPIVIRGSKGPVTAVDRGELYSLACERGWKDHCSSPLASM
jgi:hypothetical protein